MAHSNRCSSCLYHFDSQIRIPVTLPCQHQVCQICGLKEYQKDGSNQCPKIECKKVSFADPKSWIDQKSQQNESEKEQKQLHFEESKNEITLQKQPKQVKVQILTENKEKINLAVEEGEMIEQLKQEIESQEGIDPQFYELYRDKEKLDKQLRINKKEDQEEVSFILKLKTCNYIKFRM